LTNKSLRLKYSLINLLKMEPSEFNSKDKQFLWEELGTTGFDEINLVNNSGPLPKPPTGSEWIVLNGNPLLKLNGEGLLTRDEIEKTLEQVDGSATWKK
jgi:hypothetical protein